MTQNTLMPNRRSVVRAAAWTVPAVSLAVAAPAFAASNTAPALTLQSVGIVKGTGAQVQTLTWTVRVTNTTGAPITGYTVNFAGSDIPGLVAGTLTMSSTSGSWTVTQSPSPGSAVWSGSIAAGASIDFVASWQRTNNSGGSVTATVTVPGKTGPQPITAVF